MKYSIFGAGPCGCYLAYHLSKNGHAVTLYEKENTLLGCWATHRINGKFTEHAPRVLFDNYLNTLDFFDQIGINFKNDFFYVHNNLLHTFKEILSFSFFDILILSYLYLFHNFHQNEAVSDLFPLFSESGRNKLEEMCYLWDGIPPNLYSIPNFIKTLDTFFLYSMYLPKNDSDVYYLPKITEALKQCNVTIKTNSKLDYIINEVPYINQTPIISEHYIICIPPKQFIDVLSRSDNIKNNWGNFNILKSKLRTNYYTGIGIQFHFNNKIKYKDIQHLPHIFGEWKISWDVKKNYISTCILEYHNLHNLSKNDLINGVWSQMTQYSDVKLPKYTSSTITPYIEKENGKWTSTQGAYSHSVYHADFCDYSGESKLFSYVGSHNPVKNKLFPVTSHESAIMCAQAWLNNNNISVSIRYPYSFFSVLSFLIITIIILISYSYS